MAYLPFSMKGLGNLQWSFQGILEQFRQSKKTWDLKVRLVFFLQWGRCHCLQKQSAIEVNTGCMFGCQYVCLCGCIKHERKGEERREVWKMLSLIIDVLSSQWRVNQFMPPCYLSTSSALTPYLCRMHWTKMAHVGYAKGAICSNGNSAEWVETWAGLKLFI